VAARRSVADCDPSFARLLYRYWFFGWLFRDANRGTAAERAAALRHNRERARWLPVYIRRWVVLVGTCYAVGAWFEQIGLSAVAPMAFVSACVAVSVLAVTSASWLVLKHGRASDRASRGRDR
jgi:hypothetical protein